MRHERTETDRMERALREVFLRQPEVVPSEAWHAAVMARLRAEAVDLRPMAFVLASQIAWRGAILAAAAALIVSVVGLAKMPTENQLAWEWSQGVGVMKWLSQSGG